MAHVDNVGGESLRAAISGTGTTALVLSGGGITGFLYEIGVLAAFEEALGPAPMGQYFDLFVGTSAGAVVAALLANGASPGEIYRALADDLDSPFNFRPGDVYGMAARDIGQLVAQFMRPLLGAIGRALRRPRPTLAGMLADFQEHHPPGFYSTAPLEQTLCERFTALGYAHHFDQLGRALYVTGTDIDTGERLIFGAAGFRDLHICRAVAASCAIPIFFQPIGVGDRDVVDGAIAEATPLDIAVEHGARHLIYLNPLVPIRNDRTKLCLPLDGGHCGRLSEKGVGWIGEQALRLLLATKLADTRAALLSRYPELVIHTIQPEPHELPMFMHSVMSFAARRELLTYGLDTGRRSVQQVMGMRSGYGRVARSEGGVFPQSAVFG
jgi:predicted acylesterase/phospholipase RssA